MPRDQPPPAPPITLEVGEHAVVVTGSAGRWTVSVDRQTLPTFFHTMADAWEAGVRDAYRLDRPPLA